MHHVLLDQVELDLMPSEKSPHPVSNLQVLDCRAERPPLPFICLNLSFHLPNYMYPAFFPLVLVPE
jgi:hypothetical protein